MECKRKAWSKGQKDCMQSFYGANAFISGKRLRDLAYQVDATPRQVKVWFQNKRQRANIPPTKWYENKRNQHSKIAAPTVLPEQSSPVDEPQPAAVDPLSSFPNNQLADFGLPLQFYKMLASMDEATLHQFSVRCIALSFSLYVFQPLIHYFMAEYMVRTTPDPVSLVLTALQTIVNEIRVRFYFTMDYHNGSMHALQCILLSLGLPLTLS